MKSAVETLGPTRAKLTVEVPFEELKPSLDKAYKQISQQINVPGFRKGKVPAAVGPVRSWVGRSGARRAATCWSGRQDSNLRSPAPKAGALATTLRPANRAPGRRSATLGPVWSG